MIKIIKNFLEPELLTKIKQRVFSQDFPWYWRDKMVNEDHYWFNHTFYRYGKILSPHFEDWIKPILNKLKATKVLDARCNMNTREKESYTSDLHIDFDSTDIKTSILYLNTCNGGTVVVDKKEKFIPSEENKMIIFPCVNKHRGVMQTDKIRRAVININYV
jgi:hypothetical protein|tara:strand:+ start:1049 stop:1531 length:483 start_codon:yes stop_codon:yes gene_type:complete